MKKLNTDEIRELVVGTSITRPGVISVSEQFGKSGKYKLYARVAVSGKFEISDDLLCITIKDSPKACRHIWRGKGGEYYFEEVGALSKKGAEPYIIEITRN